MQFTHIAVLVLAVLADVRAAPSAANTLPRRDSNGQSRDASAADIASANSKPAARAAAPMAFFRGHNRPDEDDEEEVYVYNYRPRPAARRIHWHSRGAAAPPALMRMVAQRRTSRY